MYSLPKELEMGLNNKTTILSNGDGAGKDLGKTDGKQTSTWKHCVRCNLDKVCLHLVQTVWISEGSFQTLVKEFCIQSKTHSWHCSLQ